MPGAIDTFRSFDQSHGISKLKLALELRVKMRTHDTKTNMNGSLVGIL